MSRIRVLGFFLCFATLSAQAGDRLFSPSCRCDARDPYDQGPVMPQGRHKGVCQDTCYFRGLVLLPSENPEIFRVANIRHRGVFYTADIPADAIDEVIWQIVDAPNAMNFPAGHTETRWRLKKPLSLTPQIPGKGTPTTVMNLIFSIEGAYPEGVDFNLFTGGMKGDYVIAYRLRTIDDLLPETVQGSPFKEVMQYSVILNDAQKRGILKNSLEAANAAGPFQIYNSVHKNCSTEAFEVALDPTIGRAKSKVKQFDMVYPVWNPQALQERGVFGKQIPPLSQEVLTSSAR